MNGEILAIESVPGNPDIRIGSVIQLENLERYEVESVFEENGYKGNLILELVPSTRTAHLAISYGQIVSCYGVIRRVCGIRMSGWHKPRINLKEVKE